MMRKWIIAIFIIIILAIASIYIFVPRTIPVSQKVIIAAPEKNITQYLGDEAYWKNWWPSNKSATNNDTAFNYKGRIYKLQQQQHFNVIEIKINHSANNIVSHIILTPMRRDSIEVSWQSLLNGTMNPVKRISIYKNALRLNEEIGELLQSLKTFLADEKNIYGIKVHLTTVKDTLLLSTKKSFSQEPTTQEIYGMIRSLQQHIASQGGNETGYPMLNRRFNDSNNIDAMVAIPINKELKNNGNFNYKRMVPLRILVTEIQGGPHTVNYAFHQLENYVQDHRYASPAIPFESLITDRLNQTDTTKWITKIYYPVF